MDSHLKRILLFALFPFSNFITELAAQAAKDKSKQQKTFAEAQQDFLESIKKQKAEAAEEEEGEGEGEDDEEDEEGEQEDIEDGIPTDQHLSFLWFS